MTTSLNADDLTYLKGVTDGSRGPRPLYEMILANYCLHYALGETATERVIYHAHIRDCLNHEPQEVDDKLMGMANQVLPEIGLPWAID